MSRLRIATPSARTGPDGRLTITAPSPMLGAAVARHLLAMATLASLALLAACGGDAPTSGSTPASPRQGTLTVAPAGLPSGAMPVISVTGPSGFARSITGAESMSVPPGEYQVTSAELLAAGDRYAPLAPSYTAIVAPGGASSVTVAFGISSGSLAIDAAGLPDSALAAANVTGPGGFAQRLTLPTTLRALVPGAYTIVPESVVADGGTWAAASPRLELLVAAGTSPVPVSLGYALASGTLVITADGLPDGATARATLTGPNDFSRQVATGDTVANLLAGTYTLAATSVTVGSDAYQPPDPVQVTVTPSREARATSLRFTLTTGKLDVAVSGVPSGGAARIDVTGPNGFSRTLGGSTTLAGLIPGDYTIAASDVETPAATYSPSSTSQRVTVVASNAAARASIAYSIATGSIALVVSGLPSGGQGAVTIAGPGGYSLVAAGTLTVPKLKPGSYTISASQVTVNGAPYAAGAPSQTIAVAASLTATPAVVSYALATGSLNLTVSGLPAGVGANVSVTGPGGFSRTATANALYLGIAPGTYTVAAQQVQGNGSFWAPTVASQTITIASSQQPSNVTVTYVAASGALNVTVSGLPTGVNAAVVVSGPGGFSRSITATASLSGLVAGSYTIGASNVASGGSTYAPSIASQGVSVAGGATSSAAVPYAVVGAPPAPSGLNLTIDGLHVQQVVQTYGGTVPLVAGRDALLRVFVKASASNTAAPTVRLRFYNGATLASTVTLNAPSSAVPTTVSEGTLSSSWNYPIPGAMLQPGLRVLADVDPTNTVTESSDADNTFPTSGTPLALDVRSVPTFSLRLVPVLQAANSLQGGVTAANAAQYVAETRKLYPLGTVDVDVRAPFTTNAPALQSGDGNGAWGQILSELNALRTADGSARYYYGVVKVSYFSGIAGLGYVPGRAAMGWDYLPSASEVMAHELGHNFGRFHAPCGGVGGPDPAYPHAGGTIGTYGYNGATGTLLPPTTSDLMGYCGSPWISDYNYKAVLDYRASNPFTASAAFAGSYAQRALLVWGRVERGRVILEPAYEVDAPTSLPTRGGRHRVEMFDALGRRSFAFSFDGERPADLPGSAEHFAFVVPLSATGGAFPARIRLTAAGQSAELSNAPSADERPRVRRLGSDRVEVTWSDPSTRGVLVRDPRSGDILAFGRNGRAIVHTRSAELDLNVTGGVGGGRRERVRLPQ